MLIVSSVLFILAAVFGLVILTAILQDRVPNSKALIFHGGFAVAAIVLMIIYVLMFGAPSLVRTSLTLLVIAAIGGLSLFLLGRSGKPVPKLVVLVHPIIAIAGLIILLMFVLP